MEYKEQVTRQKSRVTWIKCGDDSTKYFHAQLKIRAYKNAITSIYGSNGNKLHDAKLVEAEFISFFSNLKVLLHLVSPTQMLRLFEGVPV